MDHRYIYISKSVFSLIVVRIRSISEFYSGAGIRLAVSICRRVCTHDRVCVNVCERHLHDIVRLRADPQPLVVSDLSRFAPSYRHMRYNLDIPYIHVQDMPPILNIPSCNS